MKMMNPVRAALVASIIVCKVAMEDREEQEGDWCSEQEQNKEEEEHERDIERDDQVPEIVRLKPGEAPPRGHMERLGQHRPSNGEIDSFEEVISPEVFWTEYQGKMRPVMMRGILKDAPATQSWDAEYLKKHYGDVMVKFERRVEQRGVDFEESPEHPQVLAPRKMNLTEFLELYESKDIYAISILSDKMGYEVSVPWSVLCGHRGPAKKQPWLTLLYEADLWISHGPTESMLHYDADQSLNCLLSGEKDWVFIDTQENYRGLRMASGVKFRPENPWASPGTDFHPMNVSSVNLLKYPEFTNVTFQTVTQKAGDCIYVPFTYMHQVSKRRAEHSVAVSLMWARTEEFDWEACKGAPRTFLPLGAFDLLWHFSGKGVIPQGFDDPVRTRRYLGSVAQRNGGVLTHEAFAQAFKERIRERQYDPAISDEIDYHFSALEAYSSNRQVGLTTADIVNASQLTIEGILECAVAMDEAINDFAFDSRKYYVKTPAEKRQQEDTLADFEAKWLMDRSNVPIYNPDQVDLLPES